MVANEAKKRSLTHPSKWATLQDDGGTPKVSSTLGTGNTESLTPPRWVGLLPTCNEPGFATGCALQSIRFWPTGETMWNFGGDHPQPWLC